MALWRSICELCKKDSSIKEKVTCLYANFNLPHKIRSTFANWIESNNWDIRESEKFEDGEKLFNRLMSEIDSKAKELRSSDLDMQLDLEKAREDLRTFQGTYATFVDNMRSVLRGEQDILAQFAQDQKESELKRKSRKRVQECPDSNNAKMVFIEDNLKSINGKISATYNQLSNYFLEMEDKHDKLRNLGRTSHPETASNQRKLNDDLCKMASMVHKIRKDLLELILNETKRLLEVLEEVWLGRNNFLLSMKKEYAGLSTLDSNSMQILDVQFRKASDLLLGWITMLDNAINQVYSGCDDCKILKGFFEEFKGTTLPKHLQHVLVIENQARILKVNGKKSNSFQLFVRMLGGLNLDQKHKSPKVSISFLPESELQRVNFSVLTSEAPTPTSRGVDSAPISSKKNNAGICEIENGQDRSFQEDSGNSSFVARFYSLQLKNLQRLEKPKGNEYVTDFKYGFLVQTSITIHDKTYLLSEVSLPVIITSQTSQEIMAKGTLIWHAAFSDIDSPQRYSVREKVKWHEFAKVISSLYLKHTERGLTPDHLFYLATMLFRPRNPVPQDHFDNIEVSYSQIMKDKLPKKEFSLWKWLQACLNLVSTLVRKEWKDGHIYGFISKEDAKRKLDKLPCGTFLLRFSESHIDNSQKSDLCGYLTVAVQELDPETGDLKLFHVRDYLSPKDIEDKGLAPILGAMEVAKFSNPEVKHKLLRFLWPDQKILSEIFPQNLDQSRFQENNPGYSGGQFSIEIFLSERRQPRENGLDEVNMHSNPSSVVSVMSPGSLDGWQHPSLLEMMDEGFIQHYNFSPKPTAKVSPAFHQQDSLPDLNEILVEGDLPEPDFMNADLMESLGMQGDFL